MCGIVGVVGLRPAAPVLLDALLRLEYRGYDSAGIATLVGDRIERRRCEGKLARLAQALQAAPLAGQVGIGHTRWATHGAPSERNAHPHATARVAVVHNGIVENHAALRADLLAQGQSFSSDTDTEVIANLVDLHLKQGLSPEAAAASALSQLEGSYALAMIFADHPDLVIAARHGAPLALGFGDGEMFLASDALALAALTRRVSYLHDGDWACITGSGAMVHDASGAVVQRTVKQTQLTGAMVGRGQYRHFMQKELHEHPTVIGATLNSMMDGGASAGVARALACDLAQVSRITLSACGSAFYAGLVGRWWFESIARIPCDADVASELRYRMPPMAPGGLGILVSQSGETADTLAALRYMREQGQQVLSILNVAESSMARDSDAVLETAAGPEIGVASTKAFTAQLIVLACLALAAGRVRGVITVSQEVAMMAALRSLPEQAAQVLADQDRIQAVAQRLATARDVLYLGRGGCYPIALEGALKLKEISYIHAEGYAAGEMKHGPIALIDADVPVIGLAPTGPLFDKTASNLQEAAARHGQIIVVSDAGGAAKLRNLAAEIIVLPTVDPFVAPVLYAILVQLLAYHVAVLRGTDVDQPRNLAKSVTVE
jgi:glucosamine--fructose-6-phosphate aminotransferase (isomerizing)